MRRNNSKRQFYRDIFTTCFVPDCGNAIADIHHIVPLSCGGIDSYVNFIGLCKDHHSGLMLHSKWLENEPKLLVYKFKKEMTVLGITSDIPEEAFKRHIRFLRHELKISNASPVENETIHTSGVFWQNFASEGKLERISDPKPPEKKKLREYGYELKTQICINCGKEFKEFYIDSRGDAIYIISRHTRKYCSYKCMREWALRNPSKNRNKAKRCLNCDSIFYDYQNGKQKFCDIDCYRIYCGLLEEANATD